MTVAGHRECVMARRSFLAGAMGILAVGSGSVGCAGPPIRPAAHGILPDADAIVDMTALLRFRPATLTVGAGAVIVWRNLSLFGHTVTSAPSSSSEPHRRRIFDSGWIPPGAVYRLAFATPGIYPYVCTYHRRLGMAGTVIVNAPSAWGGRS